MSTPETDVESKPAKLPAKMEPAQTKLTLGRKNDLVRMLKQMEKLTPDAMAVMVEVLNDKEADIKVRVDIAKTLLDTRIKLSESIARDQLTRTLGEHKMRMMENPVQRQVKTVEDDDDEQPTAIFSPQHILSVPTTTHM